MYNNIYREKPIRDFVKEQTMYQTVKNANQNNLDFIAIGYKERKITYAELLARVDKLAVFFVEQGVKLGDVVSVCMLNTPEVAEILLALSKIGAVSKWLDLRSTDKQLVKYINENNSVIFICLDIFLPKMEYILRETNVRKIVYVPFAVKDEMPKNFTDRVLAYPELLALTNQDPHIETVHFDRDKPRIIIQSSGTTGLAKSIVHTDYTVSSFIKCFNYFDYPFYAGNVLLVVAPPWVSYGLINSYYLSLVFGMQAELISDLADDNVYRNIGKFDISFAVPLHYRYIAANIDMVNKNDWVRAKCLVSGGDKIDKQELDNWESVFEKPVLNGYGCNEVLGGAVVSPFSANKNGAVGIPLYGNSIKIVDMDTRQELPVNLQGEICINTETAFKEYVNNPVATEKIKQIHADGKTWIHTGDLGYIDEEGYIHIVGRIRRAIIRAAFKIFSGTIEQVILEHYAVQDCVVVGVKDGIEGSVPMAHIVLKAEYVNDVDDIKRQLVEHCQTELKDYEQPKYYNFIDSIPYTSNNKQDYRMLEELGNKLLEEQS